MNSARSWTIWAIAMFAYIIAVMQRTSLGVAGVDATQRFDVSASALSSLTVIQLMVYAALQIPVGVILDRVGPKRLIASGALLMMMGQVTLAFAPSIGIAVGGRMLLGAGDAMTFISVIRLLASWFDGRMLPQVSQWTGNIGALGQVLSAIPFSFVLNVFGWTPAFLIIATMSALAFLLVLLLLSNGTKPGAVATHITSWRSAIRQLRESLARPGTQLGFWSHFVTQSSGTVFSLLWGFPFMVGALGYSSSLASEMLASFVLVGAISGPILGVLTARFPLRRSNLVLGIVFMMGVVWTVLLLWPSRPPFWLVILLVIAMGVGGPGSLIGFDFARTFNPLRSLGSANGVVNVGGFLASFVMMYLIGVVLDLMNRMRVATGAHSNIFAWDSFRVAFLVQYLVIGVGVVFLVIARRRTRYRLHVDEGIEVAPIWVALSRSLKRRNT
ncbi:MAG: MFS transporter [Lacisediminihabitans sp.]